MKTRILTLTAALFLLGGGIVACNESEQSKAIGIPPVAAPGDVSDFFKTYLPPSSYSYPEPAFDFGKIDVGDTECFLINSMEEFRVVAPASVDLPVIDFEKHTLIIGQHCLGSPGFTLVKQAVDTESDEMTLNLLYKPVGGASPTVITIFYFWGLYPKLPEKAITVEITII